MPTLEAPTETLPLTAYRLPGKTPMPLVPAASARAWMDMTPSRFAYRCLPLLMANQSGWFVLSTHTVRVTWLGVGHPAALRIRYLDGAPPYPAISHFGSGVLTWHIPYLFRTPPGYNLLVRGPANMPKAGIVALEGVVETDWAVSSFTMNWKMTRRFRPVTFEKDEPICQIVPVRRGELEAFAPVIGDLDSEPETAAGYRSWADGRKQFLQKQLTEFQESGGAPDSWAMTEWQKTYFRGVDASGRRIAEHQSKLSLRPFEGQE